MVIRHCVEELLAKNSVTYSGINYIVRSNFKKKIKFWGFYDVVLIIKDLPIIIDASITNVGLILMKLR